MNRRHLRRIALAIGLLALAVAVAFAVMALEAIAGNRILTATIGEEGIVGIDDTLPWNVMMGAIYLTGFAAGLLTFIVGWRRLAQ